MFGNFSSYFPSERFSEFNFQNWFPNLILCQRLKLGLEREKSPSKGQKYWLGEHTKEFKRDQKTYISRVVEERKKKSNPIIDHRSRTFEDVEWTRLSPLVCAVNTTVEIA